MSKPMATKQQDKVHKVMSEFKKGELPIGRSKKKVRKRSQAIAIALSEAGLSRKDSFDIPEQHSELYIQTVLESVRGDATAKKRIWIKNPRVKGGGYFREQKVSTDQPASKTSSRGTKASAPARKPKGGGALAGVGAFTMGAAIAAGAAAAIHFKNKWQTQQGIIEQVNAAKQAANNLLNKEISKRKFNQRLVALGMAGTIAGGAIAANELRKRKQAEEGLGAQAEELSGAQKRAAQAEESSARLASRVVDLESEVGSKQRELEEAHVQRVVAEERGKQIEELNAKVKSLEDEREQHKAKLESSYSDRLKALESEMKQREGESAADYQARKQSLDEEHKQLLANLEADYAQRQTALAVQAEKYTEEVTQKAREAAIVEINKARDKFSQYTLNEIAKIRETASRQVDEARRSAKLPQPKAEGQIAYNAKDGISLESSMQSDDFNMNTMSESSLRQRVTKAVTGMALEHREKATSRLNKGFRKRLEEIDKENPTGSKKQNTERFNNMEAALDSQAKRELLVDEALEGIEAKYKELHRLELQRMIENSDGNYALDKRHIRRFDRNANKLAKQMQYEIDEAIDDIIDQIKLDAPYGIPQRYTPKSERENNG